MGFVSKRDMMPRPKEVMVFHSIPEQDRRFDFFLSREAGT